MNQPLFRFRRGRRSFYLLAVVALGVLLAGCANLAARPEQTAVQRDGPAYVVTVDLTEGDTRSSVADSLGGDVIVWQDSAYSLDGDYLPGYAIVGVDTAPLGTMGAGTGRVLEQNQGMLLGGGEMARMNGRSSLWAGGRSSLWAGGRSSLWAGGRSSLWAGGRSSLWAGGEYTWMPENTAIWQQIRLEQGHYLARNLGEGVMVAVLDTGVDLQHPAIVASLADESLWWDFYDGDAVPQEEGSYGHSGYGHGTNVAGIIRQIAPLATILPIRVIGPDGGGDVDSVVAAIHHAVDSGADVINLSLGSSVQIKALERAIRSATARGVFVIASTGNTGDTSVSFPASIADRERYMLSVTSVDLNDNKSSFATYGKKIELAAPGENVYGPAPEMRMAAWSGTSMAAPMAAGALALALGEGGDLWRDHKHLADELYRQGVNIYSNHTNREYRNAVGNGRLDLESYLTRVLKK